MSVLSALNLSRRPALAFVIVGLYWGAFAAQVPVLKAGIGADDAQFGVILLGTSLGLVSTIWLAPVFDRAFGRWAMGVAALIFASLAIGPALATGPLVFFVAMVAAGYASGMLDVVMNARVSELEEDHRRSLMNANHGMFSAAYAVSALATGVAREAGLSPLNVFGALAVLFACFALCLRMPARPIPPEDATAPARLPLWPVLLCGGIVLLAFFVEAAVEAWSALHVERTLGGRAAMGALGPAVLGITMAVGRFGGQALAERLRERVLVGAGAFVAAVGGLVAGVAPTPLVAYLGFGAMGLGVAAIGPVGLALVGRIVPARHRTAAVARVAVIGFMGFVLAPSLMGLVSQAFGLRAAFCVAGALALITPVLMAILLRRFPAQR